MPVAGPDKPNNRVEREVEEILEKQERRRSPGRVTVAKPRPAEAGRLRLAGLSPGLLMLGALALVVLGLALRRFSLPLVLAALVLFGIGYVASMRKRAYGRGYRTVSSGRKPDVYWRGELVHRPKPGNIVPYRDSWAGRFRRWFGRR
jgi:hypothetical protein